ncbi:MAG: threonylcarbamoyl-AMP synthase [Bacteroidales bacterium]|jgi:tRNA threonylcarbamoyl adenosine modification protein (Sua5/YciO/YrdC/YwlC family)|nr:threonylcarbamoyl-AMP synthase [Bacteroidales bacterium]
MLLKIHSQGISQRQLDEICLCLDKGGVIIYPTDTLYAFACKLGDQKASQRLAQLKGKKFEKSNFSIVCHSISQASEFIKPISNDIFKIVKNNTPGGFTFVFLASTKIPKILQTKKKTIGIRIPNNEIALKIVEQLSYPIITSSLPKIEEEEESYNNPEYFCDIYQNKVDIIVDNGLEENEASTVVDLTSGSINIVRQSLWKIKE